MISLNLSITLVKFSLKSYFGLADAFAPPLAVSDFELPPAEAPSFADPEAPPAAVSLGTEIISRLIRSA